MLKRVCALALSLSLFITPSFAWSWESFVGKENLPGVADPVYDYEPVLYSSRPVMFAADDGTDLAADSASVLSLEGLDFQAALIPVSTIACLVHVYHPGKTVAGITVPSWYEDRFYPTEPLSLVPDNVNSNTYRFSGGFVSVPDTLNGGDVESFRGVVFDPVSDSSSPNFSCAFDFDLSSLGSFSSFSLSGLLSTVFRIGSSSSTLLSVYTDRVSLYVNGALVRTFYSGDTASRYVDFGSFVYDSSLPITSISFVFSPQSFGSIPYVDEPVQLYLSQWFSLSSPVNFTVLSGSLGKPSGMDSADSALQDYQQQEGEYFESANDSFNNLDTTVPGDLRSASEMFGGLFNDLWAVVDEIKYLYFTPLLFGFFLWMLGKVRR